MVEVAAWYRGAHPHTGVLGRWSADRWQTVLLLLAGTALAVQAIRRRNATQPVSPGAAGVNNTSPVEFPTGRLSQTRVRAPIIISGLAMYGGREGSRCSAA